MLQCPAEAKMLFAPMHARISAACAASMTCNDALKPKLQGLHILSCHCATLLPVSFTRDLRPICAGTS